MLFSGRLIAAWGVDFSPRGALAPLFEEIACQVLFNPLGPRAIFIPGVPPLRTNPEYARLQAELFDAKRAQISRDNALKSTGPITHSGKAISSLNAVKTGLTGRTVLLHSDDAAVYQQHIAAYANEYKPVGLCEQELVQSLADTQWRLQRIPGLEMAIYAQGRAENQDYVDQHAAAGANLIELGTFLKYEKQLRNLQLQESRLQRRYEKEMAELGSLQKERKASEKTAASTNYAGFVFSNAQPAGTSQAKFQTAPASGPQQCSKDLSPAPAHKENAA